MLFRSSRLVSAATEGATDRGGPSLEEEARVRTDRDEIGDGHHGLIRMLSTLDVRDVRVDRQVQVHDPDEILHAVEPGFEVWSLAIHQILCKRQPLERTVWLQSCIERGQVDQRPPVIGVMPERLDISGARIVERSVLVAPEPPAEARPAPPVVSSEIPRSCLTTDAGGLEMGPRRGFRDEFTEEHVGSLPASPLRKVCVSATTFRRATVMVIITSWSLV